MTNLMEQMQKEAEKETRAWSSISGADIEALNNGTGDGETEEGLLVIKRLKYFSRESDIARTETETKALKRVLKKDVIYKTKLFYKLLKMNSGNLYFEKQVANIFNHVMAQGIQTSLKKHNERIYKTLSRILREYIFSDKFKSKFKNVNQNNFLRHVWKHIINDGDMNKLEFKNKLLDILVSKFGPLRVQERTSLTDGELIRIRVSALNNSYELINGYYLGKYIFLTNTI